VSLLLIKYGYNHFILIISMKNIFISCGHNNARNWIKDENGKWVLGLYKDQWSVNPLDKEQTEYRWVSRVAYSLQKLVNTTNPQNNYLFVPAWLNLDSRIKWINARSKADDICIELHMNSWGGTGLEVFAHAGSVYAMEKAATISAGLSSSIGIKNRWAKVDTSTRHGKNGLGFIRETKPLAFLIELGFIDNEIDWNAVWVKWASSLKLILWTL